MEGLLTHRYRETMSLGHLWAHTSSPPNSSEGVRVESGCQNPEGEICVWGGRSSEELQFSQGHIPDLPSLSPLSHL